MAENWVGRTLITTEAAMMDTILLAIILVILVALNLAATRAILKDDFSERRQRIYQLIIVWALPIVGALVVLAVHRAPEKPSRTYRDEPDAGDDFGASGRHGKAIRDALDGD